MGCKISRRDGGNDGVPNLKTPSSSVVECECGSQPSCVQGGGLRDLC